MPVVTIARKATFGAVLRRIILGLLLVAAAGGFVFALNSSETVTEPRFSDSAIVEVHPGQGELELRQTRIGVELDVAYTAVLAVDGIEIPEDQHDREPALGQVFYTPGEDKETGELEPGRHCATAHLWRFDETREDAREFSWCFNLH